VTLDREDILALLGERPGHAFAALVSEGIPAEVAEASLADIPRKVALYGDLDDDDWLQQVLSGRVLALGRLQFEREPGPHGRHIHIPENGRLDPAQVDASVAWAERYFADGAPLVCESWMLDPALRQLPPTSNVRRFAARFDVTPAPRTTEGARSLAKFVFRSTPEVVRSLPLAEGATAVERIAYAALAGDGVWSEPLGVLRHAENPPPGTTVGQ
jgi:hypothetical protein